MQLTDQDKADVRAAVADVEKHINALPEAAQVAINLAAQGLRKFIAVGTPQQQVIKTAAVFVVALELMKED